jgi:hypothetical protein
MEIQLPRDLDVGPDSWLLKALLEIIGPVVCSSFGKLA